ncbi:MAG: BrnA antitoxin family protein [Rickettsia endosymbiont of Pseudomimeciton antennatum]|nr:BrnA antitoxin family protein [Rickettsia endosymbiont of Pseudomimeciton antennatum]MCC8398812.1 BrnA antitoxin family protein [Rickettsia endosymbiont of Labidopullus appendiculatus]
MKKKIKYSDGEIKEVKIISDFLPAPENLILKDNTVKITISLSKESVDFFKSQASKHHIPYQKMIKTLLDKYVNRYM